MTSTHPAGKRAVPRSVVLQRLAQIVDTHAWLYGAPDDDAPNRVERWDVRSMLDYACLTCDLGNFRPTYAQFYLYRNEVMQLLMEMVEVPNYGEWRFWETARERTPMDILRLVNRVLEAEKSREAAKT